MRNRIKRVWGFFDPLISKAFRDNIYAIAGQSAFFLVLSVFPLAMFVVSMLQNFHIPIETVKGVLSIILNQNATDYVTDFLNNVSKNTTSISFVTLLITLWSASQGAHAVTNGLNRVHNTHENRNWLFLRLRSMLITVIIFFILFGSMMLIVFGGELNKLLEPHLKYLPEFISFLYGSRFVIIYVYVVLLFQLIYCFFPNFDRELRHKYNFRNQLPGAVFSATAWFLMSFGISIYVGDFNGFSIYGSLMKLVVVMVWLYYCIVCLMLGAEINCIYHERIKSFSLRTLFGKQKKKTKKNNNKRKKRKK